MGNFYANAVWHCAMIYLCGAATQWPLFFFSFLILATVSDDCAIPAVVWRMTYKFCRLTSRHRPVYSPAGLIAVFVPASTSAFD